ncbi:MAG: Fis family transcriptional regulator [Frankiales bacterium]|nr:Fis family transcriptional regulator [Frankiales bacterium]
MKSIVAPSQGMATARTIGALSPVDPRRSSPLALTDSAPDVIMLDLGRLNLSVRELLAWLRAAQQRATTASVPLNVTIGDMQINLAAKTITNNTGEGVRLTPTEWQLLEQLVRRPGELVSRSTLLTDLRGGADHVDPSYLRVYIAQLRRKLEPEPRRPRFLITEPGLGYRFQPSVSHAEPSQARCLPSASGRGEICGHASAGARRRPYRPRPKP